MSKDHKFIQEQGREKDIARTKEYLGGLVQTFVSERQGLEALLAAKKSETEQLRKEIERYKRENEDLKFELRSHQHMDDKF